jgi:hypothetical protein
MMLYFSGFAPIARRGNNINRKTAFPLSLSFPIGFAELRFAPVPRRGLISIKK